MNVGHPVDKLLALLLQGFYDSAPAKDDQWGEGPVAAQRQRATMELVGEARRRTPEEQAEMERRKAELLAHREGRA